MKQPPKTVSRETRRRRPVEALARGEFANRLGEALGCEPRSELVAKLWGHYEELMRWQGGVPLVGAGTGGMVVERHFAESLWAAKWLGGYEEGHALDIGSGGGFPGLVLAAASQGLVWTLLEPRLKKWAFLKQVIRRMELPAKCLNVRLEDSVGLIPEAVDVVTVRALKITPRGWATLSSRLKERARLLLWCTKDPALPPDFAVTDELRLVGTDQSRIVLAERRSS